MLRTESFMLFFPQAMPVRRGGQVQAIPHPDAAVKAPHLSSGMVPVLQSVRASLPWDWLLVIFLIPLQVMSKLFMLPLVQQCGMKCFTIKLRAWKASSEVDNLDVDGKI